MERASDCPGASLKLSWGAVPKLIPQTTWPNIWLQMGLWTALFVVSTLLVNAPCVPAILRATGLLEVSPVKLSVREKAKRALLRFTVAALKDLREDEDEMLRGVDWGAVSRYVDLSIELGAGPSVAAGPAGASILPEGRTADEYDGHGWTQPASPRRDR